MIRSLAAALCITALLGFAACRPRTGQQHNAQQGQDTAAFYPLQDFFARQVDYVLLHDFPIVHTSMVNGKKDSILISKEAFKQWAQVFIDRCFTPAQKPLYKESVFQDLSTDSYTLNYTPFEKGTTDVYSMDVLLNRETNQPKRIFIKSIYQKGDTTVEEQCNWKADKSCQVNRTSTVHGQSQTEWHTISWDDK